MKEIHTLSSAWVKLSIILIEDSLPQPVFDSSDDNFPIRNALKLICKPFGEYSNGQLFAIDANSMNRDRRWRIEDDDVLLFVFIQLRSSSGKSNSKPVITTRLK